MQPQDPCMAPSSHVHTTSGYHQGGLASHPAWELRTSYCGVKILALQFKAASCMCMVRTAGYKINIARGAGTWACMSQATKKALPSLKAVHPTPQTSLSANCDTCEAHHLGRCTPV
jgi:hypothetical protein